MLAQLALVHRSRSAGQRIGAGGRLRKRDHIADRVRTVQLGDPAIEAVGDAAMRRRSVAQRLEQEAEALLGFLGADPERGEDLALDVGAIDTDRAPAEL